MASSFQGVRSPVAYAKVVVYTCITTYPFLAMIQHLSNTKTSKFDACNDGCLFIKLIGDGSIPSTFHLGHRLFKNVTNGIVDEGYMSAGYPSPLCHGYSKGDMQKMCSSDATKANIVNTLAGAPSQHMYTLACGGWFAFKVIHDWSLLAGASSFVTLKIGILSVLCQLTAAAAAFIWSMGVSEIFIARVKDDMNSSSCSCYYQLPELETLLAFATPALLFSLAIKKFAATLQAAVAGDYLYCVQYDVSYKIVKHSTPDPLGGFLVATTYGRKQLDARAEDKLTLATTRALLSYYWAILYHFMAVCLCIGATLGPIVVRLIQVSSGPESPKSRSAWSLGVSCCLVAFALYNIFRRLSLMISFSECQMQNRFWQQSTKYKVLDTSLRIFQFAALLFATAVLVTPSLNKLEGRPAIGTINSVATWAIAGVLYFLCGVVACAYIELLRPAFIALKVKAHHGSITADDIIFVATTHPEFGLEHEQELAEQFKSKYGDAPTEDMDSHEWRAKWKEQWKPASWYTSACNAARGLRAVNLDSWHYEELNDVSEGRSSA
eukprot:TRINITY_DN29372_c0_g2_i1.p1 TRINITY_DN29372_c0_g2~~TRINITY_DN29372_c0_g2_i1.p1  ORF type:complete len:550 (-),score=64.39 TRINITY_DN29372_c0_g2_i1:65-1714(-)